MRLEYAVSVLIRERNKIVKEIGKLESDREKLRKQKLQYESEHSGENIFHLIKSIENTVFRTIPENIRFLQCDLKSLNDALFYLSQCMGNNEWKEECNEVTYN
jgi:hypothetical protein